MAVETGDLKIFLTKDASPGMSQAQPDVNDSIGGYLSSTPLSPTAMNNAFDNGSGVETRDGATEYRCVGLLNDDPSVTAENFGVYVASQIEGGASVQIGLDTTAASPKAQAGTRQFLRTASVTTAPPGVVFSDAAGEENALMVGNLAAQQTKGLWIKRVIPPETPPQNLDGFTLGFFCETGESGGRLMPTDIYPKYLAPGLFNIDLVGLVSGQAVQSDAVSFDGLDAEEVAVWLVGQLAASGISATGSIEVFGFASFDGVNFTDGAAAVKGAFPVAQIKTMPLLLPIPANAGGQVVIARGASFAKGFDWFLPPLGGIVVVNKSGQPLPDNETATPDWAAGYLGKLDTAVSG